MSEVSNLFCYFVTSFKTSSQTGSVVKQNSGILGVTLGSGLNTQKFYVAMLWSESVLTCVTPQHCVMGDCSTAASLFWNKHKENLGIPWCFNQDRAYH